MKRLDRYLARTIWMSILLVLLLIVGIDALIGLGQLASCSELVVMRAAT